MESSNSISVFSDDKIQQLLVDCVAILRKFIDRLSFIDLSLPPIPSPQSLRQAAHPLDFLQSWPTYWFMAHAQLSGSRTHIAEKCPPAQGMGSAGGISSRLFPTWECGRATMLSIRNDWGKETEWSSKMTECHSDYCWKANKASISANVKCLGWHSITDRVFRR